MNSDVFFREKELYLKKAKKRDMVFIDGLHTFEASLKDVLNSLQYLYDEGMIVMHDCYPPDSSAATPVGSYKEAQRTGKLGVSGEWCGDVWKSIVYLREQYPHFLEVIVLNTDYGLGVIKKSSSRPIDLSINDVLFKKIDGMNYGDLDKDPSGILGLVQKEHLRVL